MKLRTFTGLDKEAQCACGCGQKLPANPDIRVVVDMEGWPRKRYIPSHAPEQPRSQGWKRKAVSEPPARQAPATEQAKPAQSPAPPAPAGPAPAPPAPLVEPSPFPAPKASAGVSPSLADNRPWSIIMVTASVGPYESVKVGMADFGVEGESLTAVRARIAGEVAQEMDRQVATLRCMHVGLGTSTTRGVAPAIPQTLSPASAGASPPPSAGTLSGRSTLEPAPNGVVGPEMMETRRRVSMELESDISVTRSIKKRKAANQWLKARGYESLNQVLPTDLEALRGLLVQFEAISVAADAPQHSLPEPVFQAASSEARASR